jgi:hypothetical protein
MALLSPPRTFIEQEISDLVQGDTRIKRKVRFETMHHHQAADGQCRATLFVRVYSYANQGGQYGELLQGALFRAYRCELQADNACLVEATTGAILAVQAVNEPLADWLARAEGLSQAADTLLQGDFFEQLRQRQPVLIADMIRQHIQQADAMGRFA